MISRKIFNFESIILHDLTLAREGIDTNLVGYSSKKIWANCRGCNNPHRIKGSNFKSSGSACCEECKKKEMSVAGSPFNDPIVREKANQTNLERYGTIHSASNEEVRQRMSAAKKDELFQQNLKEKVQKKYGVDFIFQSPLVKEKIDKSMLEAHGVLKPLQSASIREKQQETSLSRHGVKFALQSSEIKKSAQETCIDKYGVSNPMQSEEFKNKSKITFQNTVKVDENNQFEMVNTLRSGNIWTDMKAGLTINRICEKYDFDYQSFTAALSRAEFKQEYQNAYSFPTQQKQSEVYDFVTKELGLSAIRNCRKTLDGLELDILIPEKNFAIEFNGNYWHSEAVLGNLAKDKHIFKTTECIKKGIRLFHLFEYLWDERKNQVKGFLRSALGLNSETIAARRCLIGQDRGVSACENYHIQGSPSGFLKTFELIHGGDIVGSLVLGKHHRQNVEGNPIVLTRLVFKENITVQGGASRLFKHAVDWAKTEGYDRIISWSDNALTPGNIYSQLKFKLVKNYKQDYFYWDTVKKKYTSKQSQRKSSTMCPTSVKEHEWAFQRGLYRIWDCGKKKWEFDLVNM